MSESSLSAQDIRAAAEVHGELGPDYSDAVVESFLAKIDKQIEARVDARLASQPRRRKPVDPARQRTLRICASRRRCGLGGCRPAADLDRGQCAERVDGSCRPTALDLGSTSGGLRVGRIPAAAALARS
jgi:hypothetical protein